MYRAFFLILFSLLLIPSFAEAGLVSRSATGRVTSGLVGHWTFDGASIVNGVIRDISGQGNHGNAINIASSTFFAPGVSGQGLKFNKDNDYVTIPHSSSLNPQSAISYSFWVNWNEITNNNNSIIIKGTADGNRIRSDTLGNIQLLLSGNGIVTTASPIPQNRWTHVVVTSGNTSAIYVNGVLNNSEPVGYVAPSSSSALVFNGGLGTSCSGSTCLGMSLDDVRIYDRVLTQAEITTLYNLGNSLNLNSSKRNFMTSSLNGHWTFDGPDMSASSVFDRSRKGNAGSLSGFLPAAKAMPGKLGQALFFDGSDDNISMGDVAESGTITLAAWVKPNTVKAGMKIISKDMSGSGAQYGIATHGSTANIFTSVFHSSAPSSDVCNSSSTYEANKWYFVVATYNASTCKMYVNGVDVTSISSNTAAGNILNTTSALRVGAEGGSTASGYWNGLIDDVRIFSRALSATEVAALYNMGAESFNINTGRNDKMTDGLVGLWSFDGPDMFVNVKDRSGQGNDGYMVNFTSTSSAVTPGKIGQAIKFDGVNDYVNIVSAAAISPTVVTVSAWVNISSIGSIRDVVKKFAAADSMDYWLLIDAAGKANFYTGNTSASNAAIATTVLSSNTWYHLVGVHDGTNTKIYVNGVFEDDAGAPLAPDQSAIALTIGQGFAAGRYFPGKIDDVRIYNRTLSATEISALYNLGR